MKIALDIDGVLINTMKSYLDIYNKKYTKNNKLEDIVDFNFNNILGLPIDEMKQIFEEIDFLKADLTDKHIPATVDYWKSKGYTVDLLSTSSPKMLEMKCERLKYLGVHFDKAYRVDKLKGDYAKLYDLIVDDSPEQLEDIVKKGGRAVCYNQPWNKSWTGERVYSFTHLRGKVK